MFVELMFLAIIIGIIAMFLTILWKGGVWITYQRIKAPPKVYVRKKCYVCGSDADYIMFGTPICRKCLEKVFKFIVDEYKSKRGVSEDEVS